jgi:hypothetical protein
MTFAARCALGLPHSMIKASLSASDRTSFLAMNPFLGATVIRDHWIFDTDKTRLKIILTGALGFL